MHRVVPNYCVLLCNDHKAADSAQFQCTRRFPCRGRGLGEARGRERENREEGKEP